MRPDLSLLPALRSRRLPHDLWWKRASGVVVSGLLPLLVLAPLGRLDLVSYTLAGSMVALFTHAMPYRRRAVTAALFALWLTVGCAVALTVSAAVSSTPALILIAALLAAVTKVAHDASRVGPPGPVIPIFLLTAMVFTGQTWAGLPLHIGLVAATAALSWLVCMAPALVRPHGPERRAVALALEAAATRADRPTDPTAREALAAAITTAWRALADAGDTRLRARLEAHVLSAERVLIDPSLGRPGGMRSDAGAIRAARTPLPQAPIDEGERAQLRGIALDRPATFDARHPVLAAFRPGSSSWPYFWRTLIRGALAALLSTALGVGRPFWAITTAAVIIQPNLLLTWHRWPSRAAGTIGGVLLFAALAPISHVDPLVAALLVLALNALAELFVPRNYAIGQLFVTPMALLIAEFAAPQPTAGLVADRLIDTVLGIVMGLAAALAIRNGHLRRHAELWTRRVEELTTAARAVDARDPAARERARRELIAGLARLADAVRGADSEWWSHRVDEARVVTAQREAHRAMAALMPPG
ncbi:FUSC family protein [Microbacterium sp. Marseille-Q6965]|uniref:FUSC family protein n=1 Tax=Microbacterium sp. Marseille-Q6965 TaxID=2965072 RepID=UPI0021B7D94B|nr:FUSC family protein [Microbacterium sp. Marseille-Q6965]